MAKENRTKPINFRVTPTVYRIVKKWASKDGKTVPSWIEWLVLQEHRNRTPTTEPKGLGKE